LYIETTYNTNRIITVSIPYSTCLRIACKEGIGDKLLIVGFETEDMLFVATEEWQKRERVGTSLTTLLNKPACLRFARCSTDIPNEV
jgi:hypothetical protein